MLIGKFLHTLPLLLLLATISFGQNVEKTLVKSFNLKGNDIVQIEFNGPTELKTWDNDILRIQMTISLENGSEAMLKSLVQIGRYNLKGNETDTAFAIDIPGLLREVKVRGNVLEEHVNFTVFAPKNVTVQLPETITEKEEIAESTSTL